MSSASNAIFQRIQFQHLALNNLIQWGDHYSVDHPEIDAQHKAILELGTRVYENWRAGAPVSVLRAAVDKLASLLEAHFAYEEKLLAEIGYKALAQHAAEHRSMLKEIRDMQDYFQTLRDEKERGSRRLSFGSRLAGRAVRSRVLRRACIDQ